MSNQREAETVASPAAESVAGHEYLLEEILELLPAKSLGRFKLVSKRWLSLISDHFQRRSSSKSPTGMFLYPNTKFVPFKALHKARIPSLEFLKSRRININHNPDYNKVEILQSCNGLLLCLVITIEQFRPLLRAPRRRSKYYDYLVCNPTTEQFRLLPRTPHGTTSVGVLAFDPCVSIHYKLICPRNQYIEREQFDVSYLLANDKVLDIYSSDDNSWRAFTSPYWIQRWSSGHYLNGSVYWELYKGKEEEQSSYYFLRFDVNSEKMTQIRVRPLGPEKYFCEYFSEVGGASMWRAIEDKFLAVDIHILELSTDPLGSCDWVTKNQDCVSTLLRAYPQIVDEEDALHHYNTLCVVERRKEEECALLLAIPGKVISYNFKHKTVEELFDLQGGYRDFKAFPFTESFFAV